MDYDEIYPGLFLGSKDYTVDMLKSFGIDFAICIAPEDQVPGFDDDICIFLRFPVSFQQSDQLSRDNLVQAKKTCLDLLRNGKKIYLHCVLGYNRSPAVAVMVLQDILDMTQNQVIEYITKIRNISPQRFLKLLDD